ncbi:hypothetical protein Dimus_035138 [Dionaea muscipula]
MNTIAGLPIIEMDHFPNSPERDDKCKNHQGPLHIDTPNLDNPMSHQSKNQPNNGVQESNSETLCSELHPGPLVEEHQLTGIIPVPYKHRHLTNYVKHGPRNTEEVHEDRTEEPELVVMEQCLTGNDLFERIRGPDQKNRHKERDLLPREHGWAIDGSDRDPGLGLDELGDGFSEAGEIPWLTWGASLGFLTSGSMKRIWGRAETSKRRKEDWESLNSMSKKKRLERR